MYAIEQDFTNLSDEGPVEVTMGIQPDHGSDLWLRKHGMMNRHEHGMNIRPNHHGIACL